MNIHNIVGSRHHFGKNRVSDCRCTTSLTCRPCCEAAAMRNKAEQNVPPAKFDNVAKPR